ENVRRRVEQIGVVGPPDSRRVTQLELMLVVNLVGDETTWKEAVVLVVIPAAAVLEIELRRRALDTEATLKLERPAFRDEHSVGCVHLLVKCEIADARGVRDV